MDKIFFSARQACPAGGFAKEEASPSLPKTCSIGGGVTACKSNNSGHDNNMNKVVREAREQWDDVPGKVVGRRHQALTSLERGEKFLQMGVDRNIRLRGKPKGVFRYRTFEEADA